MMKPHGSQPIPVAGLVPLLVALPVLAVAVTTVTLSRITSTSRKSSMGVRPKEDGAAAQRAHQS